MLERDCMTGKIVKKEDSERENISTLEIPS
jgi:hypothetical protein